MLPIVTKEVAASLSKWIELKDLLNKLYELDYDAHMRELEYAIERVKQTIANIESE